MTTIPMSMQHLFNQPMMLMPEHVDVLLHMLQNHKAYDDYSMEMAFSGGRRGMEADKLYEVQNGVAEIPVQGTLVPRLPGTQSFYGMTGYNQISQKLRAAMADDQVKAVLMNVDSPGGTVSGCFDLCAEIMTFSARNGGKPIWASANDLAASAGYAILSSADKAFGTMSSRVGSIGVLTMHIDASRAWDMVGWKPTLLYSGKHKVDGNWMGPLPDSVKNRIQESLDDSRLMFAEHVGSARKMSTKKVLDTEAAVYPGTTRTSQKTAVEAGLIDGVASYADVAVTMMKKFSKR